MAGPVSNLSLFLLLLSLSRSVAAMNLSQKHSSDGGVSPFMPNPELVTFLEQVQQAALQTFGELHFDPKTYVDLYLKLDFPVTKEAFNKLPKSGNGSVPKDELKGFLSKYFHGAGDDLVYAEPVDFVVEPEGFLPNVKHPEVRAWALEVHSLWRNLSRKVSTSVHEHPQRHTLLALPGTLIIPGSRFREVYYWDSFWVVRGLLVSKMYETAKAIVGNLIHLVGEYGFVLNGSRAYYTNRSQPPLLSSMVRAVHDHTGDKKLLEKALPALLKEYKYWTIGVHQITICDSQQRNHSLSRYYANWDQPRPESSTLDKESASNFTNPSDKAQFYRELASVAESGWDFSTRWMRNGTNFTTTVATKVLPADLNAFLLKMELDITFFAEVLGLNDIAGAFSTASQARKDAMSAILWNENMGQWLDYFLGGSNASDEYQIWSAENQNHNIHASNFIPLWIDLFNSDTTVVEKAVRSLQSSGLVFPFGIAATLRNAGQQWDFPNGWAPLQHMIVEGLINSGSPEAKELAQKIAENWIRTNYVAYKKTGAMHEKYDVRKCGESGGGGEYVPQTGFGWSNGVVLTFLDEFGWPQDKEVDCNYTVYTQNSR